PTLVHEEGGTGNGRARRGGLRVTGLGGEGPSLIDPRHRTWATSDRFVPRTFIRPFARFAQLEASSGIAILAAAVLALILANSPWSETRSEEHTSELQSREKLVC